MIDPDSVFDDEWTLGPDGLLFRRGTRILLFDETGRLLLIRGHDWGKEDRSWWFTVGGGNPDGEDPRDGAIREAREETGIELQAAQVIGPVASRNAVFDFNLRSVRQSEVFFYAHVEAREIRPAGLSGWESEYLDEFRWWDVDELDAAQQAGETLYPGDLVPLARSLLRGWDGSVRRLLDQDD